MSVVRQAVLNGFVALVLAGCGGGGGDGPMGQANSFCYTIANAGGSATCDGCAQVSNTGNAFDGSLDSAASMGSGGQGTFSGLASTQPAGRVAGVYFVLPAPPNGISVSVSTYLNGLLQDSGGPATTGSSGQTCALPMECFTNGSEGFIGLRTTKSYNRIDATISNTSTGTLEIRELCVR